MHTLKWDQIGDRYFETGIDRGVLYLPNGTGVAWSGLTSISEKSDASTSPVYYDGRKISDLVSLGTFSATMKALTYPDEFLEVEGQAELRSGVSLTDQPIKTFGLCYRTKIGNDLDLDSGYKLHLIYNVTAVPRNRTYNTVQVDPTLLEFEWELVATPYEIDGFRPTAHVVIDSREVDPWLLHYLETILYGDGTHARPPSLFNLKELSSAVTSWFRYIVVDNEDGTATIKAYHPKGITVHSISDIYTIIDAAVVFLDNEGTYQISSTKDRKDILKIAVHDNGDGTWWASSPDDTLIRVEENGYFEIHGVTPIFIEPKTYKIVDTHYD